MPRELSEKDIAIFKKTCTGMRRSLLFRIGAPVPVDLPPVSNHFAEDSNDFIERINRLTDEELTYITDMIQKGEESMDAFPLRMSRRLCISCMTGCPKRWPKRSFPRTNRVRVRALTDHTFFMKDISSLLADLRAPTVKKRQAAAAELGKSGNLSVIVPLAAAFSDPHRRSGARLCRGPGSSGRFRCGTALVTALEDTEPAIRCAAIASLGKIKDPLPSVRSSAALQIRI